MAWSPPTEALAEAERLSAQRISGCYQCGKCSGNCPVAPDMDFLPNQIMRLLMSGHGERALRSRAIWLCDGCLTCSSRCPRDIDVARVMDALRILGPRDEHDMAIFCEAFLTRVRRAGRANELPLGVSFNLRRRKPFDNIGTAWTLLRKGKLPILPRRVGNLTPLFKRCRDIDHADAAQGGEKQ